MSLLPPLSLIPSFTRELALLADEFVDAEVIPVPVRCGLDAIPAGQVEKPAPAAPPAPYDDADTPLEERAMLKIWVSDDSLASFGVPAGSHVLLGLDMRPIAVLASGLRTRPESRKAERETRSNQIFQHFS